MALSPLPVVPRPLPDEHLTAWFARVAGVYSMTSLELLDHIAARAGRESLSGALSHHPAPEPLAVLARSLGLPVQTLAGLTVPRLRPLWGKAFRTDCTVGPPPLHCPACLAGDEAAGRPHHLRVDWTCALAFHCPMHAIELLPGCPACRHTGLMFSGPPAAARLHCALCHTRLGTRSAVSLARSHNPGHWPAADRLKSPDPQTTHEAPFRVFMNTILQTLAWTPTEALLGTGCPAAFRSTLVGLLELFGLPVRHDDTSLPQQTLAQTIRLPWVRTVPLEWPQAATFAAGFASLAAPTRFDLLVAVYALLSGAQDLLSCRRWRLRNEDWRVYCMGDPIAQIDMLRRIVRNAGPYPFHACVCFNGYRPDDGDADDPRPGRGRPVAGDADGSGLGLPADPGGQRRAAAGAGGLAVAPGDAPRRLSRLLVVMSTVATGDGPHPRSFR